MVAHTGYNLAQFLEKYISFDSADILKALYEMVAMSSKTGFANDKATLDIIVRIAEIYLSDYKELVLQQENFQYMLKMLNFFADSGWQEALEMIWRLNEIF